MTEAGSDNGGTVVVPLSGELDMAGAEEMTAQLAAALQPGTRRVVVDLTGVRFIDSSAIGALLQFRLRCEPARVWSAEPTRRRSPGPGDRRRVDYLRR